MPALKVSISICYLNILKVVITRREHSGCCAVLEPLRKPFKEKLQSAVRKISETETFQKTMREQLADLSASDDILQKVEGIVCMRLDELTPNMVKEIVERMIHEHLGWLVVWGGVFGGLIGLLSTFVF